ncbi:MAG: hypothetical protein RJA29_962 [Pseudomonadota bacterium]
MNESLWVSTGVVALAEMGDKTQLLAFVLAARFDAEQTPGAYSGYARSTSS